MWQRTVLATLLVQHVCHSMINAGYLSPVEFQHKAILDQMGKFHMLWSPLEDAIHIEIQVETTGYVGVGFSPNGGMKGADIVLAWVDDDTGKLNVHDRYAHGNMIPVIDNVQDISVKGGYQNDTHTVIRFSRPWNTCDKEHDLELSGDTTRIIWSYGNEDPYGDMAMMKHDYRGSKSIYLREPRFSLPDFSEDVKSVDFLSSEVRLPDHLDTLYFCQIYKIPDIMDKIHMIGYIPVIQEGNEEQVHHIILNECHLNESSIHYEKWLTAGGRQCLTQNMPASWFYCSNTIIAWAIGSEGDIYPEHVGLPLGEKYGGSDYFMMQVHYDNPNLKKGVVDNSGLRLFYTENTREMDGGVLMVGANVSPNMLIPPNTKWHSTGRCSGECTQQLLPEEGIKVFQGLLHAHLLGRAISIKQIRNGVELPTIFKDMNYDFNYQQQRVLKEEMVILPGDILITECLHDASHKDKPSFGGEGTNDEMCLVYLTYYPRMELSSCFSDPQLPNIYKPLGIEEIYETNKMKKMFTRNDIIEIDKKFIMNPDAEPADVDFSLALKGVVLKNPQEYQNKTLYDIVHDRKTWKKPKFLRDLQDQMKYGDHKALCNRIDMKPFEGISDTVKYPDFVSFKPLQDECAESKPEEIYVGYEGSAKTEPNPDKSYKNRVDYSTASRIEHFLLPYFLVCVYVVLQNLQ